MSLRLSDIMTLSRVLVKGLSFLGTSLFFSGVLKAEGEDMFKLEGLSCPRVVEEKGYVTGCLQGTETLSPEVMFESSCDHSGWRALSSSGPQKERVLLICFDI